MYTELAQRSAIYILIFSEQHFFSLLSTEVVNCWGGGGHFSLLTCCFGGLCPIHMHHPLTITRSKLRTSPILKKPTVMAWPTAFRNINCACNSGCCYRYHLGLGGFPLLRLLCLHAHTQLQQTTTELLHLQ